VGPRLHVPHYNPADNATSTHRTRSRIIRRPPRVLRVREDEIAAVRTEHRACQQMRFFAIVSPTMKLLDFVARYVEKLDTRFTLIIPRGANMPSRRRGNEFDYPTSRQLHLAITD